MKMTKRILAAMVAAIMALSVFSVAVSAAPLDSDTDATNGTITFGLDVYKVTDGVAASTPLAAGTNLVKGDIVEVQLSFGTDFYLSALYSQYWFDTTYFAHYYNGAATTAQINNIFTASPAYATSNPNPPTATTAAGGTATLYDTLAAGTAAKSGQINMSAATARKAMFPKTWKDASNNILPEYDKYNYVNINFGTASSGNSSGALIMVPYAMYSATRLIVIADTAVSVDNTNIFMTYDGIKTNNTLTTNKTYSSEIVSGQWGDGTPVTNRHTYDLENATVGFSINKSAAPTTFSATFMSKDNTAITDLAQTGIASGTEITMPAAPAVANYTFTGWDDNNSETSGLYAQGTTYAIIADTTFTATYAENAKYTVTFVSSDTSKATLSGTTTITDVYAGTAWNSAWVDGVTVNAQNGYKFGSWSTFPATITGPTTITANIVEDAEDWATVTFAAGANGSIGATTPQKVLKGTAWSSITVPTTSPASGYKFSAWSPVFPASVTESATYTANFVEDAATYTLNVYKMDTAGAYPTTPTNTSTLSGTVGNTVSVNAADYNVEGQFTVDTEMSTLSATLGADTVLSVYVAREQYTYTFFAYDYALNNGTYTQLDFDEYYYGATAAAFAGTPTDYSAYGYEFAGKWHVGSVTGAEFVPGTVTQDLNIYAEYAEIVGGELDYTAITNAIAKLPNNLNLFFFKDSAIIEVAAALNQTITADGIDAFLAAPYAYKNMNTAFTTQAAVNTAASNIETLATNLTTYNSTPDGNLDFPYRDESKAEIKYSISAADADGNPITTANPGDIITFTYSIQTNCYLSSANIPIIYDADKFNFVGVNNKVFTKAQVTAGGRNGLAVTNAIVVDDSDDAHYDMVNYDYEIEAAAVQSYLANYGKDRQSEDADDVAYRDQYKILLVTLGSYGYDDSLNHKFEEEMTIFSFRLQLVDGLTADGSITTTVGFDESWFAAQYRDHVPNEGLGTGTPLYVVRAGDESIAAGPNQLGIAYDFNCQWGQTFTADNAEITIGSAACTHNWSEWAVDALDNTKHTRTCSICDEIETADHEMTEVTTPATCTEAGSIVNTCSVCGHQTTEVIPATGHTWGTTLTYVDTQYHSRTCTVDGAVENIPHTAGPAATCTTAQTCTLCGGVIVPALGHDWGEWVDYSETEHIRYCQRTGCFESETAAHNFEADADRSSEATCTTAGLDAYTCADCGRHNDTELGATGHLFSDWVEYNDTQHYRYCTLDCGETGDTEYEDHTFELVAANSYPASCESAGQTEYVCPTCSMVKDVPIPATGHLFDGAEWVEYDSTYHRRYCTLEDGGYEQEAHDLSSVTTEATCTEAGSIVTSCSKCSYSTTEVIPATGHSYSDTWTDYDETSHRKYCTVEGCTEYISEAHSFSDWAYADDTNHKHACVCGREEIEAHTWVLDTDESYAATETATGLEVYYCSVCLGSKQVVLPQLEHTHVWGDWEENPEDESTHIRYCTGAGCDEFETAAHNFVRDTARDVAATCLEAGIEAYTCSDCGKANDTIIDALGHDFSAWYKFDDDVHKRDCQREGCDVVETEDHSWVLNPDLHEDPTETLPGRDVYDCSICNGTKEVSIPALGHEHTWGDWTDNGDGTHSRVCIGLNCTDTQTEDCTFETDADRSYAATCYSAGLAATTCSVCGAHDDTVIPATGAHTWSAWTDNGDGNHIRSCTNEGCTETETAAHTFEADADRSVAATCYSAGLAATTCSVCGAHDDTVIPATGAHTWSAWTDNGDGNHIRSCTNEGCTETETAAHTFEADADRSVAATCYSAGFAATTCSVCGAHDDTVIPATGAHTWSAWTDNGDENHIRSCTNEGCTETQTAVHEWTETARVPATTTEDGYVDYTCSVCSATKHVVLPKITSNVIWANYSDILDELSGYTMTEEDEYIYVLAQKEAAGGSYPIKVQIRLNGDLALTLTYTRTHPSVISIENVEFNGVPCELWKISKANLQPGNYTVVAKYVNSVSFADVPNVEGAEFTIAAVVPVYDNDIYAIEIATREGDGRILYTADGKQTITVYTGVDVTKVQLRENGTNATMTYTSSIANVEAGTYEGAECLVWTIERKFAVGTYSYSVYARSAEGMADSGLDLDFVVYIPAVVIDGAQCVTSFTATNPSVVTGTATELVIVTNDDVKKIQLVYADGGTLTYSSASAVAGEGTLTWTISKVYPVGAQEITLKVFATKWDTYATKVAIEVTKAPVVIPTESLVDVSIDDNDEAIALGTESTITVVTSLTTTKIKFIDNRDGGTMTFADNYGTVTVLDDAEAGTRTWTIRRTFAIGDFSYDLKLFDNGIYTDAYENALEFVVINNPV